MRMKNKHRALRGGGCWVVEKEGRKERSERWSREIFIPRESGGWPVRAPCLMRRSQFPDAGLPSSCLLYYLEINYYYIKYIYASIIERLVINYITLETYKVAIFYVCIVQIPYKHN